MLKINRNLKGSKRETASNIQGSPNKAISRFLNRNIISQKGPAQNIPNAEKQGPATKLLYPARLSIKMEGEVKSFPDIRRLKEYTSPKPALQNMLKGLL